MAQAAPTELELQNLSDTEREALLDDDEKADLEALAGGDDDADDKDKDDKSDKAGDDDKDDADDKDDKKDDAKSDDKDDAGDDAKDDKGKDDKGADAADDKGTDADKDKDGKKKDDAAADDSATDTAAAGDDDSPFVARYNIPAPEKYEERMKGFDDAKAALQEKFKAGDIEMEEMLLERDKIDQSRTELREQKLKSDMAREQDQQAQEQRWFWEVDRFVRETRKADGVDLKDKALNKTFDNAVKLLASDPENKDKSSDWFLDEAYAMVKARHGVGKAAGKDADKDGDKDKDDKGKPLSDADKAKLKAATDARNPDLKKIPRTLGTLPAAADATDADSDPEFAALDKLDGMELENALARLPKDKADRYLKAGA